MNNNPFDVANYKSQIDWTKSNYAHKISIQQTAVVNRQRAAGVEPSGPYSENGMPAEPEKFAIDMPKLAKYVRPSRRKPQPDKDRPLTVAELEAKWNARADNMNQWSELGIDEIVWYAQTHKEMEKAK